MMFLGAGGNPFMSRALRESPRGYGDCGVRRSAMIRCFETVKDTRCSRERKKTYMGCS